MSLIKRVKEAVKLEQDLGEGVSTPVSDAELDDIAAEALFLAAGGHCLGDGETAED